MKVGLRMALFFLLLYCCTYCGGSKGNDPSKTLDAGLIDSLIDGVVGIDLASDSKGLGDSDGTAVPDSKAERVEDSGPAFDCKVDPLVIPEHLFFTEVSAAAGIQTDNYVLDPSTKIPINDHSRLAFADINGDGFDDIVAHSLFPNPQAGIPFEHIIHINNQDGTYTNYSDLSGLRNLQSGFFAFGDLDNDGDQDCFSGLDVQLGGATHQVLLNDGEGHFTPVANAGIETVPPAVANAVFADFNGDSKLDLFLGLGQTSYSAPDAFFFGNGDGTFTDATGNLAGNPSHPTNGSTTCDYDNDGDVDIIVSTYSVSTNLGLNILWENDGAGNFKDVASEKGFASLPTGNYFLSSTGNGTTAEPGKGPGTYVGSNGFGVDCDDINNDGLMDIFLTAISHPVDFDYNRKWSDPTQLLTNSGSEGGYAFVNEYIKRGLPFNEGDVDGAAIDFDNDGRMDLSVSRDNKYEKAYENIDQKSWFGLMHQQSDGSFLSIGPESGINDLETGYAASLIECVGDDECPEGEACLFTRCRQPCTALEECAQEDESCVWLFNGDLGIHQSFCRPYTHMKRAQNHAWADVDRDGDLDLLVGGRDFGGGRPNFLFRNDIGSTNRWIAIDVKGDGHKINRDAIGTQVAVVSDGFVVMREVQSSRGMYNSMDTRTLHFGLGSIGCDYELQVRWPDGTTATFPVGSFPERSFLTLGYPDTLTQN